MVKSEEKRRQILGAAVDEFLERGFESASMDRIAARAEVSKRTVYNHFEGKDALFLAIVEQIGGMIAEVYEGVRFDPNLPLKDQLTSLGLSKGTLLRSEEFMRLARVGTAEIIRTPDLAQRLGLASDYDAHFYHFFAAAEEAGVIRPGTGATAATQFLGILKAQAYWPAIYSGVLLGEKEIAQIVETSVGTIMTAFATGA